VKTKLTKGRWGRSAGVLLHPTSLPGPYGIGDLGETAYSWLEAMTRAKQTWWQILPLNPTGYGDSPYSSYAAFAGNPYLVSPDILVRDGLLQRQDLAGASFPAGHVDYARAGEFKLRILRKAWNTFQGGAGAFLRGPFDTFCGEQAGWLDDYALYIALKEAQGGAGWQAWPRELVLRQPDALARARKELANAIGEKKFQQFLFFRQWRELKTYANARGIKLIGDVPIFVSADSTDVWSNPDLFQLDEHRRPRVVAGVPPDYFSATGQLWGNPLYDWDALRRTGYVWWVARIRATLQQVDLIRLDHFRGFDAYWEIPAGMPTAEIGRWVKAPGAELMTTLRDELDGLPFVAEDLGIITPEVEALRDGFHLPGMRILQFAFGGAPDDRFLPHNYEPNAVVYTGTHDNDTTRGWYKTISDQQRDHYRRYAGRDGSDVAWDMIRLAWMSVADYALAPLQDVMDLGPEARMNLPGRPSGNWQWRFTSNMLTGAVLDRLGGLTEMYGRG
jgi:4-alpha-glucanotransferase